MARRIRRNHSPEFSTAAAAGPAEDCDEGAAVGVKHLVERSGEVAAVPAEVLDRLLPEETIYPVLR
jgi:hypothetical protein